MKSKLKHVKKIKDEFVAVNELLNNNFDKINKEHNNILVMKLSNLIQEIANGENLDESILRDKYLHIDLIYKILFFQNL